MRVCFLLLVVAGPHPHDLCLRDLRPLGYACDDSLLSAALVVPNPQSLIPNPYTNNEDTELSS